MSSLLKDLVLWNYSREASVYVIFCLLIIAFIFLTPKTWFDKRETVATQTSRIIVQQSDFSPDKGIMQKRVREISGDPNAEIIAMRDRTNEKGERFYEIEVR